MHGAVHVMHVVWLFCVASLTEKAFSIKQYNPPHPLVLHVSHTVQYTCMSLILSVHLHVSYTVSTPACLSYCPVHLHVSPTILCAPSPSWTGAEGVSLQLLFWGAEGDPSLPDSAANHSRAYCRSAGFTVPCQGPQDWLWGPLREPIAGSGLRGGPPIV